MRYGICLPNFTDVASPDTIDAAAGTAERLGWETVWTTDHVLVDRGEDSADYRTNYDALGTLAWVGARHPRLRLATSVIVVPQRNAVVLAKELATLDSLSGGQVVAGVGGGWNEREFGNLAMGHRFAIRGAYLDETIMLWRHLWSGSGEPFRGKETIAYKQAFLRDLWNQAKALHAQKVPVAEAAKRIDMTAHKAHFDNFTQPGIAENVAMRLYQVLDMRAGAR